jgi:hypothetical protein
MTSIAAHQIDFFARFKRTFLIFWVPFTAAAVIPAIAIIVASLVGQPAPQAPSIELPAASEAAPTAPSFPPTPANDDKQLFNTDGPAVASEKTPPKTVLIGAKVYVYVNASKAVWHVTGLNQEGKTLRVVMKNDDTQERASAPVDSVGWKWDPKTTAPAEGRVSDPKQGQWIWLVPPGGDPNSNSFQLSPGPPRQ